MDEPRRSSHSRAVILGMRSTEWIVEHRVMLSDTAIVGWMPVVEGAEAVERARRDHGSENVIEWEETDE